MTDAYPTPIIVTDPGSGEQAVRFGQWLVEDGEFVLAGDRVAELLVRGVLLYVTAPVDGRVEMRWRAVGTVISPGTVIGLVHDSDRPDDDFAG